MQRSVLAAAIVLCLGLPAAPVSAQAAAERAPYRGLFGGDARDAESTQLTASLFGAYDDNVVAEGYGGDPRYQVSGRFLGTDLSLNYSHSGDRVSYGLDAGLSARHYPELETTTTVSYGATGNLGFPLGSRGGFSLAQSFYVSPFYSVGSSSILDSDPLEALPPSGDYAVQSRDGMGSQSRVGFDYRLSRRDSLGFGYSFGLVNFVDENRAQTRHSAGVTMTRRFSRYSTLRVGYGYRRYQMTSDDPVEAHDVQAGIDYSRPWALSGRRTILTVTPGTSIVTRGGKLQMKLAGSALLEHQMGRSWTATANYKRGLQFVDGLEDPVDGDSVTASIGGYLSQRVELVFNSSYLAGRTSGDSELDSGYDSLVGSARLQYAIASRLAAFAEYVYYHYVFGKDVTLPDGFAPGLDRHGFRVGLTTTIPLFR